VAVLPWGATEPHNLHLPYGTDTLLAEHVASESARRAWALGARPVVLPAVPFGVQTTQLDLRLCLNVMPSTQLALLGDLAASLAGQGVRKLVILNAHGGNDFRPIVRELAPRVYAGGARLFVCVVNWWQVEPAAGHFDEPGDHAGELETSALLHARPELVRPLGDAGPGRERPALLRGMRERWAWAPRPWSQVTDDTGVGDPRAATAEKGARFVGAACAAVAAFLAELEAADPGALYERLE
jgi:creatinine amidohydrolase